MHKQFRSPPGEYEFALPTSMYGRAALIVGHPGHELRVYGWLGLARPLVLVLTDGSGHSGRSRLEATSAILAAAGAQPGSVYGAFTDSRFYSAMMEGDLAFFTELASEIAVELARHRIDYVVGDATEGYNPTHDVCRLLINAAVEIGQREHGLTLANYAFDVVARPGLRSSNSVRLHLSRAALSAKIGAARTYSAWMPDAATMLEESGEDAFQNEDFCSVVWNGEDYRLDESPYYERYGEKQVAAGYYSRVLRDREHVRPIAAALREHVRLQSAQGSCVF